MDMYAEVPEIPFDFFKSAQVISHVLTSVYTVLVCNNREGKEKVFILVAVVS